MQKFPIDSDSNENFISPFFRAPGTANPQKGKDTFGTRLRPHAKFGMNWPAGCWEIIDRTKKNKNKKYIQYNKYLALRSNERMAGKKSKATKN